MLFFFFQRSSCLPSNTFASNWMFGIVWNLCSQGFKHPCIINNMKQSPCGVEAVILTRTQLDRHLQRLFNSINMGSTLCTQQGKIRRDLGNERLLINTSHHRRFKGGPCSGQYIAIITVGEGRAVS